MYFKRGVYEVRVFEEFTGFIHIAINRRDRKPVTPHGMFYMPSRTIRLVKTDMRSRCTRIKLPWSTKRTCGTCLFFQKKSVCLLDRAGVKALDREQ